MNKKRVYVTQKHIDEAVKLQEDFWDKKLGYSHYCRATMCPVALALRNIGIQVPNVTQNWLSGYVTLSDVQSLDVTFSVNPSRTLKKFIKDFDMAMKYCNPYRMSRPSKSRLNKLQPTCFYLKI